ncbi:MAG TPA: hypothetical protein VE074_08945 [Jatrophihabitantaceae bacterium]|nr:hypothetical protein [Jatrophihabitantaceae bacterium]
MKRGLMIGMAGALVVAGCSGGSKGSTHTDSTTPATSAGAGGPLPVNSGRLLAGTARPSFSSGTPGTIQVVATGEIVDDPAGAYLPIAIRSNVAEPVARVVVAATIQDATGKQIASGSSQGTDPQTLAPGEVALSFVHFEASSVPGAAAHQFTIENDKPSTDPDSHATLKVTTAAVAGGAVTGTAANQTGATLSGPYAVNVYCFDPGGKMLVVQSAFADLDGDLAASKSVPYTVNLAGHTCPSFLVGVTAFYK